jgi:hypothetical protein
LRLYIDDLQERAANFVPVDLVSFQMKSFESILDPEEIKAVLIEHLGIWEGVYDAEIELKDNKFKECKLYIWGSRNLSFVISQVETTHYYLCGGLFQRNVKKILRRLQLEDQTWILRKVLFGLTHSTRLKIHDVSAYIPFAGIGAIVGLGAIILALFGVEIGVPITVVSTVVTFLLYGLHRYGVSERAIDIRFLAISLEYTIVLYGIPASLILVLFWSVIPLDLNAFYYAAIMIGSGVATNAIFIKIVSPKFIQGRLRRIWAEIRLEHRSDRLIKKKGSPHSPGYRLGDIGAMRLPMAYGFVIWMTAIGVAYYAWIYGRFHNLLTNDYLLPYFLAMILLFVVMLWSNIALGEIHGINYARKRLHEKLVFGLDDDGFFMFWPLIALPATIEVDLEKIWGIGPVRASILRKAGIAGIDVLSETDNDDLRRILGNLDVDKMKEDCRSLIIEKHERNGN